MDSIALVSEELQWGIALIEALSESDFPMTEIGWLYERELDDWRLLIASSVVDQVGSLQAYRKIGEVAASAELPTNVLQRVTLVSPSDPTIVKVKHLFGEVDDDSRVVSSGAFSSERAYLYNQRAIAFEHEVLVALQRVAPPSAVIRRSERLFYEDPGFDFVVADGNSQVLVEAKVSKQPLATSRLRALTNRFRTRPPLLLVSNAPLTDDASSWIEKLPDLRYVRWISQEDDEKLRQAVVELLGIDS